jgi:asparagine synthase (glutamine-hydrolysing)
MYDTDHHEIQMDIDVYTMLDKMAEIYDEPFGDSSNIPAYLISKYAHDYGYKAIISGDGGDEAFGGYRSILWDYANIPWAGRLPMSVYKIISCGLLRKISRKLLVCYGADTRIDLKSLSCYTDPFMLHQYNNMLFKLKEIKALIPQIKKSNFKLELPIQSSLCPISAKNLDRCFIFDYIAYLPGDILYKIDRSSMAASVEVRSPFLDEGLIELASNLHADMKMNLFKNKIILRRVFDPLWPEAVKNGKKQGFGAPIKAWLKLPKVRELTKMFFYDPENNLNKIFSRECLQKLFSEFYKQNYEYRAYGIWSLLCFYQWFRKWSRWIELR